MTSALRNHLLSLIVVPIVWLSVGAPSGILAQATAGRDSAMVSDLKRLVRRANPGLRARRAAVAAAEARLQGAGALAPAVLSAEVEEVPDGLDLLDAGSTRLDLSRDLRTGGRRAARRLVAGLAVEQVRLELALAQRALDAQVDGLLSSQLGNYAAARRLAAQDSLLLEIAASLTARFAVGDARYVDVLRIRTERLRTQGELVGARTEALAVRRALGALVAIGDSTSQEVGARIDSLALRPDSRPWPREFPPAPALDSLVAASGPVVLAEIATREARARASLASAEMGTRLAATIGMQRFAEEGGGHALGPTLGVSLTLPFTAGGANRAARAAVEHDVAAAEASQQEIAARTQASLGAARDRYESAIARLSLFDAALLEGAADERQSALGAFRTGTLSLLELLDFERALVEAELVSGRSRVAAAQALQTLLVGAAELPRSETRAPEATGGDR